MLCHLESSVGSFLPAEFTFLCSLRFQDQIGCLVQKQFRNCFLSSPFQGVAPEWFGQVSRDVRRSGEGGIR